MRLELSSHAQEECQRRNIPVSFLEELLDKPQQRLESYGNRIIYQSKFFIDGNEYLIRAVVDENTDPNRVITVYRTSKIQKYWRVEL